MQVPLMICNTSNVQSIPIAKGFWNGLSIGFQTVSALVFLDLLSDVSMVYSTWANCNYKHFTSFTELYCCERVADFSTDFAKGGEEIYLVTQVQSGLIY